MTSGELLGAAMFVAMLPLFLIFVLPTMYRDWKNQRDFNKADKKKTPWGDSQN